MPAKLLLVSEQLQTSQEVAFEKPRLTIGRKAGNDLHFNRAEISGTHAAFLSENNGYFIQDLGSTNGTFMNGGQLAAHQKYPFTPADVVVIAPYRITLVIGPDMTRTFAESPAAGRVESGTIMETPGRRVGTGTAEHEAPVIPPPPPPAPAQARPPEPKPQPAPARPVAPPSPAVQPAPPKPEPVKAEPKPAPRLEPRPEPKPAMPRPSPPVASVVEDELDIEVPSAIGDYLWLAIGAVCFLGAIALIFYLLFGF